MPALRAGLRQQPVTPNALNWSASCLRLVSVAQGGLLSSLRKAISARQSEL